LAAGAEAIDPHPDFVRISNGDEDELARRVVAAVMAGDRDAFRVLIERDSAAVIRICQRVLGNLQDAEDAAQEAFVTAYRAIGTWRSDGPFAAWLARIAVRVALRHAGRRSKTKELAWIDPPSPTAFEKVAFETVAGEGGSPEPAVTPGDPEHVILRWERAKQIRSAVAALDEPYREVVALRFFGDLSLAEIAATSGRPVGTIKTHLHRGLLRLRIQMETDS
jgi:RNA polymerase sigma-70 factor (ECF subfamily)